MDVIQIIKDNSQKLNVKIISFLEAKRIFVKEIIEQIELFPLPCDDFQFLSEI